MYLNSFAISIVIRSIRKNKRLSNSLGRSHFFPKQLNSIFLWFYNFFTLHILELGWILWSMSKEICQTDNNRRLRCTSVVIACIYWNLAMNIRHLLIWLLLQFSYFTLTTLANFNSHGLLNCHLKMPSKRLPYNAAWKWKVIVHL